MNGDSLGDRMKSYERAFRAAMPRRVPVIVRVDGKAFHTLTRRCERPFDAALMTAMNDVAIALCQEAQGAAFAFVQSDEISLLLHNYRRRYTDPWFDNEVQKIVSISASIATAAFPSRWGPAHFDARVFILPESEVCNYFIWRQQDATRNSIQMAARAVYSHAEVDKRPIPDLHDLLHAKGINWNDYPVGCKRGRAVVREAFEREGAVRHRWVVEDPPIFTADRDYVQRRLAVDDEGPEDDR